MRKTKAQRDEAAMIAERRRADRIAVARRTGPWLSDDSDDECAIEGCTEKGVPQACNGDGQYHHHGCVHLAPGTATKPGMWRWMCDKHHAADKAAWAKLRGGAL
jgi:hypothetical protein